MRGTPWPFAVFRRAPGIIPAHAGNTGTTTGKPARTRDHPRACGEHRRGNRKQRRAHGIIPAHAGNTYPYVLPPCSQRDHPRACGEHSERRYCRVTLTGSSPRMRGTRGKIERHALRRGIIPAHAGNTIMMGMASLMSRDHPRACGEHRPISQSGIPERGSSPRMRGTPESYRSRSKLSGIIPAHAGNTFDTWGIAICPRDHPRACGEHLYPPFDRCAPSGSSPRMRGTLLSTHYVADNSGDHPRACGEHADEHATGVVAWGSSPRMRGTLLQRERLDIRAGIIPAHAGNTRFATTFACA